MQSLPPAADEEVPLRFVLPTLLATARLGRALSALLHPGDLVLLSGPLGAGKTFLAGSIGRGLGVPSALRITSPTFALVHEYPVRGGLLIHADLYRLRGELSALGEAVDRLGLLEQRQAGAVLLVEWGEEVADRFGADPTLRIHLNGSGSHSRVAEVRGAVGERYKKTRSRS